MFEPEVKATQEKLKKTLALYARAEKIQDEIWASCNTSKDCYYIGYRLDNRVEIYSRAMSELHTLIESTAGAKAEFNRNVGNSESFEKACKFVLGFTNQSILNHFTNVLTPWRQGAEPQHTLKGDTIELKLGYGYYLRLVLNVLNIFVNDTIENKETYEKCREVLKNSNTFVYRDVKITCYENGKIKLVFADNKTLKKMLELLKQVKSSKGE